jgi:hypothetical protein
VVVGNDDDDGEEEEEEDTACDDDDDDRADDDDEVIELEKFNLDTFRLITLFPLYPSVLAHPLALTGTVVSIALCISSISLLSLSTSLFLSLSTSSSLTSGRLLPNKLTNPLNSSTVSSPSNCSITGR